MIIDAKNLILGRMGTYVAKKALLGEKIDIVNCEQSVVSGRKEYIYETYKKKRKRGVPRKGPFSYRFPDRFVKRSIRGMLPYNKARGKVAYGNVKCHIGLPENLKNKKIDTIKNADADKLPNFEFVTVKDICMSLGAKIK